MACRASGIDPGAMNPNIIDKNEISTLTLHNLIPNSPSNMANTSTKRMKEE